MQPELNTSHQGERGNGILQVTNYRKSPLYSKLLLNEPYQKWKSAAPGRWCLHRLQIECTIHTDTSSLPLLLLLLLLPESFFLLVVQQLTFCKPTMNPFTVRYSVTGNPFFGPLLLARWKVATVLLLSYSNKDISLSLSLRYSLLTVSYRMVPYSSKCHKGSRNPWIIVRKRKTPHK